MNGESARGIPPSREHERPGAGLWGRALRRFLRNKLAVSGAIVVLLLSLAAVAAPILPLENPARQDLDVILVSPGLEHPLGTDRLGRDTLSRLIYGARTSLAMGVLAQVIVLAIGIPVGVIAGVASARVDNILMRGVDIVYAFPNLLLIIILRAIFGGSISMMFLGVCPIFPVGVSPTEE